MPFDPDAFLSGNSQPGQPFDPDAFLADSIGGADEAPRQEKGFLGYGADTVLEAMAAVNRGAIDLADMPATLANAVLQVAGSDTRVPFLRDVPFVSEATRGEFMEPGLARDAVRFYGEVAAPGVPIGKAAAPDDAMRALIPDSPTYAKAAEFADAEKVPLMTTDVSSPKTFIGRSAQAAAEKVPVAGTGAARAAQQESRSGLIEEFSKRFGAYDPQDIYKSLESQRGTVKAAAGKRRANFVNKVSDVVAVDDTIKTIDEQIEALGKTPTGVTRQTADTQTIDQLMRFKDDLLADPSFKNLEELRTVFRETVKGDRPILPGKADSAISKIYQSMTGDMDSVIKETFGDVDLKRWKKANAIFADEAAKIKKTRLRNVLDKGDLTPEVVENMLFSQKPSEVKVLFNSLTPQGKEAARAGIVAKAFEKSGGSPDKFLNTLDKMAAQTGVAFKGADKKYVDGLKSYLSATKEAARAAATTKSGQELFQVGIPAALVADFTQTGGAVTGGAAAFGLLARAYESKPVRNLMMRIASSSGPRRASLVKDANKLLSAVAAQNIVEQSDQERTP